MNKVGAIMIAANGTRDEVKGTQAQAVDSLAETLAQTPLSSYSSLG